MFKRRETPEYLEKKNMVVLIMYNVLFMIVGIFAILSVPFRSKIFNIVFISVCGGILVLLFIIALLYKDDTTTHFKKEFDKANRGLTYSYLVCFLAFIIFYFLVSNKNMSEGVANILIYLVGSIMVAVSMASIAVNSYVIVKNQIKVPLSLFLEDLKNKKQKENKK